jgi:hypothetical protein
MSDTREAGSGLEGLGSQTPLDVHPGKAKGNVQHGNPQVGSMECLLQGRLVAFSNLIEPESTQLLTSPSC